MRYEIMQPGAFAFLKVQLEAGESIKAESDAMMAMSGNIKVEGKMEGGMLGGLARKFLSGESLFFQHLTAQGQAGEAVLAPPIPGDVSAYELTGNTLCITSGGFLAAEESVKIETKMQNLGKGLFSGAGLFVVKASGTGTLLPPSKREKPHLQASVSSTFLGISPRRWSRRQPRSWTWRKRKP